MKYKNKLVKRSFIWIFIVIFCLQLLLIALGISNPALADAAKPTFEEKAQTWAVYSILDKDDGCKFAGSSGNNFNLQADNASRYAFFPGSTEVRIGYVGEKSSVGDGKIDCNEPGEWWLPALEMWGLKNKGYGKILESLGYVEKNGEYLLESGKNPKEELRAQITQFFDNGTSMESIKYYSWMMAFKNGCKATIRDPASADDLSNARNNRDNYYLIQSVDPKGNVSEKVWYAELGKGKRISVGWDIGAASGGEADCAEIGSKLNTPGWAQAFAKDVRDGNVASTIPGPTSTPPGDDKESGCSQALTPFGWILCPIANVADNILSWYEGIIKNILYIDPVVFENGSSLQQVWRIFSNLASALIVLIALTMIVGQIFNFEIFSAYTVKKVLPRLIIGAVLIQLSWFLCATLIQLVNAIGTGLYWLILAPLDFGDTGTGNNFVEFTQVINYSGNGKAREIAGGGTSVFLNGLGAGATVAAGAAGAAIAVTSGAWVMIIVAAIGVIISLIVGIVTLMIRAMLIVILIVLAPLALAAWILPGTQNFWNMWWKMFSRLLMMFPLIMLLFAGGVLAGAIMASAKFGGGGADVIANFAIVVAYFAPVFMISMTYKFAGTAFSSIATLGNKLGDKASGSGLFGLRDRAKFAKENSSWAMSNKNREGERTRAAQSKYTERIGGDSRYGKYLRRKASKTPEGQARIQAAAAQAENEERMKEAASFFDYQTSLGDIGAPAAAEQYLRVFKANEGQTVDIGGKQVKVTKHMRKEALERIAQTQQITQMREAAEHIDNMQTSTQTQQNAKAATKAMYAQTIGKNYPALKEKAPDLSGIGGDLRATAATDMMKWDKSTWKSWQDQFDPNDSRFAEQYRDLTKDSRTFTLTGDASAAVSRVSQNRGN